MINNHFEQTSVVEKEHEDEGSPTLVEARDILKKEFDIKPGMSEEVIKERIESHSVMFMKNLGKTQNYDGLCNY